MLHQECGKTYHVWKYGLVNLILWIFTAVSYLIWNGGGEGARARGAQERKFFPGREKNLILVCLLLAAMVLTIFFFASCAWGVLLWQSLSHDAACWAVIEDRFHVCYILRY